MASKKRTRQGTFTHMSNLIGTGKEMLPSELPTLRCVLRYGLLLRERSAEDMRNYPAASLAIDIYPEVLKRWGRANCCFVFPIITSRPAILRKIRENWEQSKNIALGRGKLHVKEAFVAKLYRLFDILNCKCKLTRCSEFGCSADDGCKIKIHITCTCPKEMKIPVKELAFIIGQREKIGSIGPHQIGLPDLPEHNRQVKRLKREEEERRRQEVEEFNETISEEVLISSIEIISSVDDNNEQTTDVQDLTSEMPNTSCIKYNTLEIHNVAMQSIRYGVGLRAAAAITTAAFMDAGLITQEDKRLVVDHSKIKRAQEKVMNSLDMEFDELCKEGKIECIFFDGRQDMTKVLLTADNSNKQFPSIIKEEHYSVCSEPGGRYLYHLTPKKGSSNIKPAEIIADNLVDFFEKKGIDKSLQAIGCDSTNANTGWAGGAIHWVEVKLRRKLIWLICAFYTNELPLRHLMKIVDGKTLSNNKWTGDIGKMLDIATSLEIDPSFVKLSIGEPLIVLSENDVKDLSNDQAYGYRITEAIKTGKLPTDLAVLEIGPVSHSRWLTTANRVCRIWVLKHGRP